MKQGSMFDIGGTFAGHTDVKPRDFRGEGVKNDHDRRRLGRQIDVILGHMRDGEWWDIHKMQAATGYPLMSIDAQFRNARKPDCNGYGVPLEVERSTFDGLSHYRLTGSDQEIINKRESK